MFSTIGVIFVTSFLTVTIFGAGLFSGYLVHRNGVRFSFLRDRDYDPDGRPAAPEPDEEADETAWDDEL